MASGRYGLHGEGLRNALAEAELPALLPALAHLTDDLSILEPELRPTLGSQVMGKAPQGGLSEQAQARARHLAEVAVTQWVERGCPEPIHPDPDRLLQIMRFVAGPVDMEQLPLLYHQLGIRDEVAEADTATKASLTPSGSCSQGYRWSCIPFPARSTAQRSLPRGRQCPGGNWPRRWRYYAAPCRVNQSDIGVDIVGVRILV